VKVQVKLFAGARQLAGAEVVEVELAEPARVGMLREALARQYPSLSPLVRLAMVAIDTDYVRDDAPLTSQSDVALIPPVSGG
jgi:molybdopterin converting factor subunit 1